MSQPNSPTISAAAPTEDETTTPEVLAAQARELSEEIFLQSQQQSQLIEHHNTAPDGTLVAPSRSAETAAAINDNPLGADTTITTAQSPLHTPITPAPAAPVGTADIYLGASSSSMELSNTAAGNSGFLETSTSTILSASSPHHSNSNTDEKAKNKTFSVGNFKQSFCPICLERYTLENPAMIYEPCRHAFHFQCAESWLMRSPSCPVCSVPINSGTGHVMTLRDVKVRKQHAASSSVKGPKRVSSVETLTPSESTDQLHTLGGSASPHRVAGPSSTNAERGGSVDLHQDPTSTTIVDSIHKKNAARKTVAIDEEDGDHETDDQNTPLVSVNKRQHNNSGREKDSSREGGEGGCEAAGESGYITPPPPKPGTTGTSENNDDDGGDSTPTAAAAGAAGGGAVISSPVATKIKNIARTSLRKFGSICCW